MADLRQQLLRPIPMDQDTPPGGRAHLEINRMGMGTIVEAELGTAVR